MYVIENIIGGQLLLNARDMRPPGKQRLPLTARHRHSVEAAATGNEAQAAVQARYSSSMDAVSSPSHRGVPAIQTDGTTASASANTDNPGPADARAQAECSFSTDAVRTDLK